MSALHITQQRAREKTFLARQRVSDTPFARVATLDELWDAVATHRHAGHRQDRRVRLRRQGAAHASLLRLMCEHIWTSIGPSGSDASRRVIDFRRSSRWWRRAGSTVRFAHYGAFENGIITTFST